MAGTAGVFSFNSIAAAFLFQVSPTDTRVLSVAIAVLGLVGTLAALLPARRADGVDPLRTLRD